MLRDGYPPGKKALFAPKANRSRTKRMFWELYNQNNWWYMYPRIFIENHPTGTMNGQSRRPSPIILPIDEKEWRK